MKPWFRSGADRAPRNLRRRNGDDMPNVDGTALNRYRGDPVLPDRLKDVWPTGLRGLYRWR